MIFLNVGIFPREEWNMWNTLEDNFLTNNICEGTNNQLFNR